MLSRDQRSEKQLANVPRRVKVSLRLAFEKSRCQREHSYSSKLTSLSRSVLTMRYPATPLPESCLSVPREVIHNQSFPQFKTMQYLAVLHKVIHNHSFDMPIHSDTIFRREIICNESNSKFKIFHRQEIGGWQISNTWSMSMATSLMW